MEPIKIILADDEQVIHDSLRMTLDSTGIDYTIVSDCYSTLEVTKYLKNNKDAMLADILILDHYFGGVGKSGLEYLPTVREIAPWLPILMLTTFDDMDSKFSKAHDIYKIDYIQKPVKATDLKFRMNSIIKAMEEWENIQKSINEDKELLELYDESNRELEVKLQKTQDETEQLLILLDEQISAVLPISMQQLIQNVFPDVEFKASAFRFLVKRSCKPADWNRMFKILKMIDWKQEGADSASGIRIQKYTAGTKMGYDNLWEYRFSQAGRIFVDRRKNAKPLIVLIAPNHEYSDMASF